MSWQSLPGVQPDDLGRTEEDLVDSLEKVTQQLLSYENNARRTLFTDASDQIRDKIWRAYGILANARF